MVIISSYECIPEPWYRLYFIYYTRGENCRLRTEVSHRHILPDAKEVGDSGWGILKVLSGIYLELWGKMRSLNLNTKYWSGFQPGTICLPLN